jgi:gluconokinase
MVIVVAGVAGAGKTTVGRALAADLGWPFHDADDLHSPANIAQIARGERLTDAQRQPWLGRVRALIDRIVAAGESGVIACSALREPYRQVLANGVPEVRFVFLDVDADLARARVASRPDHFAGTSIIASQFDALERPANVPYLDASLPVPVLVGRIKEILALHGNTSG